MARRLKQYVLAYTTTHESRVEGDCAVPMLSEYNLFVLQQQKLVQLQQMQLAQEQHRALLSPARFVA